MKWHVSQPAQLLYPFGRGWTDFFAHATRRFKWIGRSVGSALKTATSGEKSEKSDDGYHFFFAIAAVIFVFGFTVWFSFIVLAAHLAFLLLWAITAYLTVCLLSLYTMLWSWVRRIALPCPVCHVRMPVAVFVCPCGKKHTRLWPSRYGVFYHRCTSCQRLLPTMDILGRRAKLKAECSNKHRLGRGVGELPNIHIPVFGGRSAGKSNFTFTATRQLIEVYCRQRGYTVEFPDPNHRLLYEDIARNFDIGCEMQPTSDYAPQAYTLVLRRGSFWQLGHVIYFYDAAGEAFRLQESVARQSYLDLSHGLVFVIDPLSIDSYRRLQARRIEDLRTRARPSTMGVMESYGPMMDQLRELAGVTKGKLPYSIAVVLTKADALDLPGRIGREAALKAMNEDPTLLLEEDARHVLVKRFLQEQDLGNLVRDLQNNFQRVRFFSCSALGRMPAPEDQSAFVPLDVAAPLTWLLGSLGVLNSRREHARAIDKVEWTTAGRRGLFGRLGWYLWGSVKPRRSSTGGSFKECPRCTASVPHWSPVHIGCLLYRARFALAPFALALAWQITTVAIVPAAQYGYTAYQAWAAKQESANAVASSRDGKLADLTPAGLNPLEAGSSGRPRSPPAARRSSAARTHRLAAGGSAVSPGTSPVAGGSSSSPANGSAVGSSETSSPNGPVAGAFLVSPASVSQQAPGAARPKEFQDCAYCPEMVRIPGGSFVMGSPLNEAGRGVTEGPAHRVQVSAFALGKYTVTFAEWDACVTEHGCVTRLSDEGRGRGSHPVINVNWVDAHQYVHWLSRKSGHAYRLPSEAEWEYAARAGTTTAYYWGTNVGKLANCPDCSGPLNSRQIAPVGSFYPNPWGLYNMVGDVYQWTEDCWHFDYRGAPPDGRPWTTACAPPPKGVFRGSSSGNAPGMLRSAARRPVLRVPLARYSNVGLRVAMDFRPAAAVREARPHNGRRR